MTHHNQEKLARICWNDYGWVKPSGRYGKSKSTDSHEGLRGFGHEEWLLDIEKLIDGYHYGFLQPIGKYYDKYIGETFNISLFSIHNDEHQFYWVGKLNNVEVISREESRRIIAIYKKNGWWDELKNDLKKEGLKKDDYDIWDDPKSYFNVRFKPEEVKNILKPFPFKNDGIIPAYRYTLYNYDSSTPTPIIKEYEKGFDFYSGSDSLPNYKKTARKKSRQEDKELVLEHNETIQNLFTYLKKTFPDDKVRIECTAYGKSRVDVVRRTKKGDIFYEVKTYNLPRVSIRQAIGQLLEYSLYPDADNAIQLSIVTPRQEDKNIRNYIANLNSVLKIPLTYIHFDNETKQVITEISA